MLKIKNKIFKKIFQALPVITLITVPSIIAFYNDSKEIIDCQQDAFQDHPRCALAANPQENTEKDANSPFDFQRSILEIETLKEDLYEERLKNLEKSDNSTFLEKSEEYHIAVLDILQNVSLESKVKVCQNNKTFIPSTQTEAQIKEICEKVSEEENQGLNSVQGANTESEEMIFQISIEDFR